MTFLFYRMMLFYSSIYGEKKGERKRLLPFNLRENIFEELPR